MPKSKRPKINISTQIRLWVASGGRCEFPGCNKPVWKDNLTFMPGNFSQISHIIGQSPNGPRGSEEKSKKYAKDFNNLMLLCSTHNKLIDDYPDKYTISFLRESKKAHEKRIKTQTGIQLDRKTTIIRFQANIKGRKVEIPSTEINMSTIENGRYPDDKGYLIDLTSLEYDKKKSLWSVATNKIKTSINQLLTQGNDGYKPKHISIFGLGPIPLLVYLGFVLSNAIPADIYIKLRNGWTIKKSKKIVEFFVNRKNIKKSKKEVALLIAITGTPTLSEIGKNIDTHLQFIK